MKLFISNLILATSCSVLLIVCAAGCLAFGVDRIENHHLLISGSFFMALGIFGILLGVVYFWCLARETWQR
jgi:membrane associated rhomboid family serine protease